MNRTLAHEVQARCSAIKLAVLLNWSFDRELDPNLVLTKDAFCR
jgi:hypothetical protein